MSAACGSGTKPATCTLVMNSLTAMQASLEVAKSGELSDEFHAFLEFLWDSCDLIVSFVFSSFPNVPMYVDQ